EAEAGMLGQPVYFLTPEVVGVHMTGQLREGVTATDLVLHITQLRRAQKVVGKFVEFYGEGAASLPVPDRATIGNMSPEYGATMGYFPIDQESVDYLRATGRSEEKCLAFENYFRAQKMFGMPLRGEIDYSVDIDLDLAQVQPSVAGPKRPQDRINLPDLEKTFRELLEKPVRDGGYGKQNVDLREKHLVELNGSAPRDEEMFSTDNKEDQGISPGDELNKIEMVANRPTPDHGREIEEESSEVFTRGRTHVGHGSVVIAAITSCTNTSNPSVMIAAGLLAKNAVERGLDVKPYVKTTLAPGSRVVMRYLDQAGLTPFLEKLGFYFVGVGCFVCIGNSGPLATPEIEQEVKDHDLNVVSVLSGNRNFEGRIHPLVKSSYLASPPLVVAYALAGTVHIDLQDQPLGDDKSGKPVFLKDLWPTPEEVNEVVGRSISQQMFAEEYGKIFDGDRFWKTMPSPTGLSYQWDPSSTYVQEPPFFQNFSTERPTAIGDIMNARVLVSVGDSVTTDHISPAGSIPAASPAGQYLVSKGVKPVDFNQYGTRRGNHEVLIRGTFANIRLRNKLAEKEGWWTRHFPSGEEMTIYDASMRYQSERIPLVLFAGKEYGSGSSRDWAAKGPNLMGVRAAIAESFERIHRSNLVMMGIIPLEFMAGETMASLGLTGQETFTIRGLGKLAPKAKLTVDATSADGKKKSFMVLSRVDDPTDLEYVRQGGILHQVLRERIAAN